MISLKDYLPNEIINEAIILFDKATLNLANLHSTRAMAFAIKGLYYANLTYNKTYNYSLLKKLSNRLVQMYIHESEKEWQWFESYLTYGNSILPEALLCAYLATNDSAYKNIAITSFEFLLEKTFTEKCIKVISNKGWLQKGYNKNTVVIGGEQPIDVAYTVMALEKFYNSTGLEKYYDKMQIAFSWFLGNNHLQQIIYNPSTGGCYDGLEEDYVNLNQGAESTVSYLMARLTIERAKLERIFIEAQVTNTYQLSNVAITEEVM